MDARRLDLLDLTVSQAVLMLHQALEEAPGEALQVAIPPEEMFRDNLMRVLAQRGRSAHARSEGGYWVLDVRAERTAGSGSPSPSLLPLPPVVIHPSARPVVLTREGLGSGRSGLARHLLLGVLRQLPADTPWLLVALDAVLLLEDPRAMEVIRELQGRGIPVRLSRESALLVGDPGEGFDILEDMVWQRALAGGTATLL